MTKENASNIKAVQKYRRVKTIVNKAVEVGKILGLKLNVLVYDSHFHRLRENYTAPEIKLEAIHRLAEAIPNTTKSKMKLRELKFQSIDANLNHLSEEDFPICEMPLL